MRIRVLPSLFTKTPRGAHVVEPVTFGVPVPPGLCTDKTVWALVQSPAGVRSAVQTRVLDRWADGSTRWLLVDAQVHADALRETDTFLETVEPSDVVHSLAIHESPTSITVDTGAATFTLRSGDAGPLVGVSIAGTPSLTGGDARIVVTDQSGTSRAVSWGRITVEHRGALRTVILARGESDGPVDGVRLRVAMRLHFHAGHTAVRALTTVTNPRAAAHTGGFWDLGDPGSVLIRDLSWVLPSSPEAAPAGVRCSPETGTECASHAVPFAIYQDSSGGEAWQSTNHVNRDRLVPVSFRGYRIDAGATQQSGLRATPVVLAGAGEQSIGIAVPRFWQNFPQALESDGRSIRYRMLPAQFKDLHELQAGEQKTWECWLAFGASAESSLLTWGRSQLAIAVDPGHVLESGAVPFLAPLSEAHRALVDSAVDGPDSFATKREVIDQFGWRHFGEIYGDHESIRQKHPPLVSHYNNQYDPLAGFLYQYLRTADSRWWAMGAELAAHVIDIDVYHTTEDSSKYNGGMFWHTYHYGDADTATHRTYPKAGKGRIHGGGPSADHNYTTGLMLHYFLTGDEASRETVIGLARYVVDLDDGRKSQFRWIDGSETGRATLSAGYYGPGRGPANSLNALIDGHRLSGDGPLLAKAEQLMRRTVHPDDDIRRHRLDDPEARWFYTMFFQSLGKYLHYKVELGARDEAYAYGRAALLHYVRWMAEHEYPYLDKPEKLEFPTETWAAQDIRKSDVFHYASLHAAGDERGRFVERGRFFHQSSVTKLASMPTRTLARPVIVLLTSGFMNNWVAMHPNAVEPEPSVIATVPPPQSFVPQIARVKRKLAVGAALAMPTAAVVAWLLLR